MLSLADFPPSSAARKQDWPGVQVRRSLMVR